MDGNLHEVILLDIRSINGVEGECVMWSRTVHTKKRARNG